MMGMESRGDLNEERESELLRVLQRQHLVTVTKGAIGESYIGLKMEEAPEPLAKWCIDHKEQVTRIAEFVFNTLKEEASHQMTTEALFQEIRDEFGAKGLRKMMEIKKGGKVTDDQKSELFE